MDKLTMKIAPAEPAGRELTQQQKAIGELSKVVADLLLKSASKLPTVVYVAQDKGGTRQVLGVGETEDRARHTAYDLGRTDGVFEITTHAVRFSVVSQTVEGENFTRLQQRLKDKQLELKDTEMALQDALERAESAENALTEERESHKETRLKLYEQEAAVQILQMEKHMRDSTIGGRFNPILHDNEAREDMVHVLGNLSKYLDTLSGSASDVISALDDAVAVLRETQDEEDESESK